jgi:hypothetical protein
MRKRDTYPSLSTEETAKRKEMHQATTGTCEAYRLSLGMKHHYHWAMIPSPSGRREMYDHGLMYVLKRLTKALPLAYFRGMNRTLNGCSGFSPCKSF